MSNKALTRHWGYPIKRDGKTYWVDADSLKVMREVSGGATAATPSSQAQAAQAALNQYLSIAANKPYAITGTVASGLAGGSTSNVTWNQQIPIVPAFCTAIDYQVTLPVALTLGATTGAATLSPFAPYSAIAMQMTLGGAPPWPLTELTPWHIDDTQHRVNYDPFYPGLGNNSGIFASIVDQGPTPQQVGGTGSLAPGATVTNTTASAVTTNYTFTFTVRVQLQRKRHLLWGAVPFGDPENRPNNITQIYPLVGTLPEQALFINGTGATAVLNGAASVTAVYRLSYIDLLPAGLSAAPAPTVGFGLQLTAASTTGLASGTITPVTHRVAQIYTAIHQIMVNGGLPVRSDYFGLWDDQDQQSARWAYDAQLNTFQNYFTEYHRKYRRYPYTGVYSANFDDGEFPEVASVTPYNGMMTPDASYAATFGVPVTPAMTTALRLPSGVTANNPYLRNYELGLVRIPY